jgi:hypothetical protein
MMLPDGYRLMQFAGLGELAGSGMTYFYLTTSGDRNQQIK